MDRIFTNFLINDINDCLNDCVIVSNKFLLLNSSYLSQLEVLFTEPSTNLETYFNAALKSIKPELIAVNFNDFSIVKRMSKATIDELLIGIQNHKLVAVSAQDYLLASKLRDAQNTINHLLGIEKPNIIKNVNLISLLGLD